MSADAIRRMARVWERMRAMYGSRWDVEFGPVSVGPDQLSPISRIWAETLEAVTNAQIAMGLRACLELGSETPPSLPKFARLCGMKSGGVEGDASPRGEGIPQDSPADHCERLAAKLAEEATIDLRDRLSPDMPEESRRSILRGYWLSKIGNSCLGKTVSAHFQATSQPLEKAA